MAECHDLNRPPAEPSSTAPCTTQRLFRRTAEWPRAIVTSSEGLQVAEDIGRGRVRGQLGRVHVGGCAIGAQTGLARACMRVRHGCTIYVMSHKRINYISLHHMPHVMTYKVPFVNKRLFVFCWGSNTFVVFAPTLKKGFSKFGPQRISYCVCDAFGNPVFIRSANS